MNHPPKRTPARDAGAILPHLEALADALGIQIRYEQIEAEAAFSAGGLCRLKDRLVFIINAQATPEEKIETLGRALKRFDLGSMYLKPALRDYFEKLD